MDSGKDAPATAPPLLEYGTLPPPEPARDPAGRTAGVVMLIAASILWSLAGVAVKVARMDPLAFTLYRSLAASVALAVMLPLGRRWGRAPRPEWATVSALLYTAVLALFIISTTVSTAAAGILLQYTSPVFCALFAWLFLRRRIGPRTLLAMAIASAGIAVMVAGSWRPDNWVGPVTGVLSGAAFGALVLVLEKTDRAAGPGGVNPLALVLVNNIATTSMMIALCWARGTLAVHPWQLALVAATGVVQLALPYVLFQLALRRVRPVDASLLILLEPVLNPTWVALVTGERPDGATVLGGVAILVALVIEARKPAARAARRRNELT
jgi:drug/metabolite transporter, DME family